jgi:hypothetical protein
MLGRSSLVFAALGLAFATSSTRVVGQSDPPSLFTLAIVRRDAILIPFATWTGQAWVTPWPIPKKSSQTPIALSDLPKRWWGKPGPVANWHAWTRDGNTQTLRSITPTWYLAHCQQGTGIRSSYTPSQPAPPPIVQPYPKDGVATSSAVKFNPIGVMNESSPVWKAVAGALPERLVEEEDRVLKLYKSSLWQPPRSLERRREVPVTVEALYRVPLPAAGRFLYYFEAVKRYSSIDPAAGAKTRKPAAQKPLDKALLADARADECELVTFVSGWFRAGNADQSVTLGELRPILTSCDYASADVMFPLAYTEWNGYPLWIVQFSGWGREWYTLFLADTAAAPRMLLETSGGSCPVVR